MRLARIVHAADIDADLHIDPAGAGLLALGLGGLDVEADDHRLLERASFVYDALYAWCVRQSSVSGLPPLDERYIGGSAPSTSAIADGPVPPSPCRWGTRDGQSPARP